MKSWIIVYGDYLQEKRAVELFSGLIKEKIDFPVEIISSKEVCQDKLQQENLVIIGTKDSNVLINKLIADGKINKCEKEEEYFIFAGESAFNSQNMMMVISGFDTAGVTFGAVDMLNIYLADKSRDNTYNIVDEKFYEMSFTEKTTSFSRQSAPAVKMRAIWTWAHCIYDYQKFFENMMMSKLNTVVMWTDYLPINAKEVVDSAHSYGIKVFWGFSWGWETDAKLVTEFNDETCRKNWAENIVKRYEEEFAPTNADGIYFQTFTERKDTEINGKKVALLATEWVNYISDRLWEKYPDLKIQFGLHAISVKEDIGYLKDVNKNMEIVWEDAGAFPFNYYPLTENFDETVKFAQEIAHLRGDDDKFGVVLKGMTTLNWLTFKHQTGQYVMGKETDEFLKKRLKVKEKSWKYFQAVWMEKFPYAKCLIDQLAKEKKSNLSVQMLVEDGMFECGIFFPVAILSEMMWDIEVSKEELIRRVALFPKVKFC